LFAPLARLIAQAATTSQVAVSHVAALVCALAAAADAKQMILKKQLGETLVRGDERSAWRWLSLSSRAEVDKLLVTVRAAQSMARAGR